LRVCWLLLGGAFVIVLGFLLFTILVKGPNPPSTAPAEQPVARHEEPTPSPSDNPENELVRADEVDRILGGSFKTSAKDEPPALPDAPPPLTPPANKPSPLPDVPPPLPQPSAKASAKPVDEKPVPKPDAPPPPPAVKPTVVDADAAFEKRLQTSAEDLREQLLAVPELRLFSDLQIQTYRETEKTEERTTKRVPRNQLDYAFNAQLNQVMRKAGLKEGLPLLSGPKCQLDRTTATIVQTLSKDLRDMGFVSVPGTPVRVRFAGGRVANVGATTIQGGSPKEKIEAFKEWCDVNKVEKFRGALPTLLQMLQVEDVPTRLLLVRELSQAKTAGATAVLAKRAIVDLSPEVRQAAVAALRKRPADQYVPVLLQGLRYPWAPVADHAAAALRALKPQNAVPKLIGLIDQPDPSVPVLDAKTKKQTVRELVRLNHMRNCLLCHAPSASPTDGLVRGLVPTPGQPLPRLYYAGQSGNFVRADITFLRQDFSINLPVEAAAPWPNEQRFDFLTRVRALPPEEMPEIAAKPGAYPQHEAVLYALRGITGKDAGETSAKWRDLLRIAEDKDANFDKTGTTDPKKRPSLEQTETSKTAPNSPP
jgi:hypothetical protein